MRVSRSNKKHHWLLMSAVMLAPALLSMSLPLTESAAGSTGTENHTAQMATKKTAGAIATETPATISNSKKSHRLIRRHNPATTATAVPTPSTDLTSPVPATSSATPLSNTPQENTTAQTKESGGNKPIVPMSFAAPIAPSLLGQVAPSPAPTSSPLIGSAAPTARIAAASPSSSSSAKTTPASMKRLFAEMPGVALITEYEDPDPGITAPTLTRNPAVMSFSAVQNGAAPTTQVLTISNSGPGTLAWTATSNSTWLKLNNSSSVTGNNLGSVSVGVVPSGLAVGTHSGVITILGAGAANSPQTLTVTLDITAAPTPTIGLSATTLSFSAVQGGTNPAAKTITLSNSGTGTLSWTATENSSWLNLSPASGTGAGTITVSVMTTGMTAGTYSAPITIAATGATNTPQTVTVTLTLTAQAAIGLSPTSMGFTATQGGPNPTGQTLAISNTGGGTLNWTVSDNASWLTMSPASGTGSGTSTATITTTGLTPGTYAATITVTAAGASNTPSTIPVTLTLNAAPVISRNPTALTFTAIQGGANPTTQNITIANSGTGTLNWTASDNAAWLTITPASGTNTGTITASVNTSGLTAGSYSGTITITATGATNTPQTVAVSLTVTAPVTSTGTLTWTANTEPDLAGYRLYRRTSSTSYSLLATLPATATSYVATGLQSGTTYYFKLNAFDSSDNESPDTATNVVSHTY